MSARDALEMATLGGAGCLGRAGEIGELSAAPAADLVVWPLDRRPVRRGAAPTRSRPGCAAGRSRRGTPSSPGARSCLDGVPVHPGLDDALARHRAAGVQAGGRLLR